MGLSLRSPVTALAGVGPARARALAEAGCRTLLDLLLHLPSRWEDRRRILSPAEVEEEGQRTLRGRLTDLRAVRTRRRGLTLVRGRLCDEAGSLDVLWFNRPYLPRQIDASTTYLLHGQVRRRGDRFELLNPTCEAEESALEGGTVVPVYPALGRFGPTWVRRTLRHLTRVLELPGTVPERLPPELRRKHGLPSLGEALVALHDPPEGADADLLNRRRSPGQLRLIYGELFEMQLELALLRHLQLQHPQGFRYRVDERVRQVVREILPFPLTGAQRRVLGEIVGELAQPTPMLRLLQGDVGSGKTIIAALALVVALESGLQGAFMAPTEILAEQHFRTFHRLLAGRYRLGLLTASASGSEETRRGLGSGEIQLAVGTHALIQDAVSIPRLGLVVIDEQHRFGVGQRQLLERKGERPDVLVMTATPIPRSLALTAYGDLELSILDELPPGRQPIATEVHPAAQRAAVYRRLRDDLAHGARAYVVFPLIEDSEEVAADSLAGRGAWIRQRLPGVPAALLHGRLPGEEREAAMRAFANGQVQLLIATTVIEVGLDVPEATVMIIESAERFGLSQLHQLRGRVGRGRQASRCVALHGRLTPEASRRLEVFASTQDGFEVAEADLEIRGPGDLLGTRQAGIPRLRAAHLLHDREWLERAREDARELLPRLGEDALAPLRRRVEPRARRRLEGFAGA